MNPPAEKYVLAVHGGTGMRRASLTPELESAYHAGLRDALLAGHAALQRGGAVDGVEAAVRALEDNPLFNAGRGAVFTRDGHNELDASIMDGRDRRAGAVAMVTTLRNPISAARAVMERSPHVLLVGAGAEAFAASQGLERVPPDYFRTERRWNELQKALATEGGKPREWGTVGAVACDAHGNLAAATSTGGMTAKFPGRVGDSPVIGAGTYADNAACAVSATGHGEFFIRFAAAHEIAALIKYRGWALARAAEEVIHRQLGAAGGEGGVIAIDAQGNVAMPYNSQGLYRGMISASGNMTTRLYES